ncbi:deoxyribonuclease-2-like [Pollicipes pollicipes]|uniref:deoxyribonuclease-2-like n=1 Tax=Pollicipes pollicipes TaxID=41117 RepID=UPI001884FD11|nr:deoxyribonuclease-2-like [Pollicipes pollicipes]
MAAALCVLLAAAAAVGRAAAPLGCLDQDGAAVDWYVLYKLPRLKDADDALVQAGIGYTHFSSAATTGALWTLSEVAINDSSSAAGRTLAPVYAKSERKSLLYVFYNDEKPDGPTSFDKGHTKGVVAFDGDSGFWLVHSVPHYPPPPGQPYDYPDTGERYGQSFLCVTLAGSQVETVAQQLLFNEPFIFASQLAADLAARYPLMERVVQGDVRSRTPWFNIAPLATPGGQPFVSYAKARAFGKDLYADLAAPALRTPLLTETWMNGPHDERIPSDCELTYPVQNVQNITVVAARGAPAGGRFTIAFTSTHDHSKWAVSSEVARPWVCVGDINRMTTQEERGGGTVCHSSSLLWHLYSQLVERVEPCAGKEPVNVYRRRP